MDSDFITLESADGDAYQCKILGVFDFDAKEYALLQKLSDDESGDSTVIMQLVEKDDQAVFRTIESDEEFERVMDFVKTELMGLADGEDEDDEFDD